MTNQEYVVPKSIPTTTPMSSWLSLAETTGEEANRPATIRAQDRAVRPDMTPDMMFMFVVLDYVDSFRDEVLVLGCDAVVLVHDDQLKLHSSRLKLSLVGTELITCCHFV